MLPLVPTLALALVSFFSSTFVILRIVIPILPPNPLSRRVPPSEFGLPNFKTLSAADKSHIWLASCDMVALVIFVWQAVSEYLGGPTGYDVVNDPGSAGRLWIATTLRQSCLLLVAAITLLHVRLGQPVAFGAKHWMLWCPTLLLIITSTVLAAVLAGTGVETFFWGLLGYSASVAVISSVTFGCLIGTLLIIRRNLAALGDMRDPWPPASVEEKSRRRSFATEDINVLKDNSSWITSRASSRSESISAFSFSTHYTNHSRMPSNASSRAQVHPNVASYLSIPTKSSFWFGRATPANGRESPIPPVPPLPAPYRPSDGTYNVSDDPDPFHRVDPRIRMGSQSSWLTESPGWQNEPSISQWSFSTSRHSHGSPSPHPPSPDLGQDYFTARLLSTSPSPVTSRPHTPGVGTDVLGGYGYAPDASRAETSSPGPSGSPAGEVDISMCRAVGWLVSVWFPMGLAVPYYVTSQLAEPSAAASFLMVLSVTISAPLLAANILFRSPLPIPSGLFDTPSPPPSVVHRAPSPCSSSSTEPVVREYKRSGSTTVIEDCRSGDVWIANGDAVDGKTKVARALTLLRPKPKLSVLPPQEEEVFDGPLSPPLPIQDIDGMSTIPLTPQSRDQAQAGMNPEMGTRKKDSKASSYCSEVDESVAFATKIMIAQRHYSTLAMTVNLPPSPKPKRVSSREVAATTAVEVEAGLAETKRHSHLRARSISSINSIPRSVIGGPPSTPLPPTPPTLKCFKAANASKRLAHRKSYSANDEFSFGPIENDNTREIDELFAGLLPLLVPGLEVGEDIKITDSWKMSPTVMSRSGRARKSHVPSELGSTAGDISSPLFQSTPQNRRSQTQTRTRKISAHKTHASLPSLSLRKGGLRTSSASRGDADRAPDHKRGRHESSNVEIPEIKVEDDRRIAAYGEESAEHYLKVVAEEDESSRPTSPCEYSGFPSMLDVREGIRTNRSSLVTLISALDRELKFLPPSPVSDTTLCDFDPSVDGVLSSTPQESKTQAKSRSRDTDARSKSLHRSSFVYFKTDENVAPDTASPVVRPLVPKTKSTKHRVNKPYVDQENVTLEVEARGLRPLSLLQDREHNSAMQTTKPLSLGKNSRKAQKEKADAENIRREPSLKRALKPLKLVRSETTKQRAILREQEALPDVVVRPPSDGQHFGLQYTFH
ncbi:uncharacterized protein PHACADRAFT_181716 [Phanerochaete carnosa HHB-10118-sp]|uniref:Uncharacterized protein n=1 Tax=Phanerochaete carnosa (strain HHB-10118-sp) TaxID=650164 RepID=K5VA46_PHACS|nr:uncharacterized protein PHACADRAFT_181716 [Phanerochaete carnosa HHB-10118-sp]EKM59746.1 hypothetical protein PHACADRAFT_181716 [Phanerochaete carnosa HHB-10118-sp]